MMARKGASLRGRLFVVGLAVLALMVPVAQADGPPNILVIMADDHGQWALGSYGLDAIATPNIDYLAEQGVLFRNAMSPAPVCSAARASFYTGKMPSQHGVHDYLSESEEYETDWLADEVLLSERLQALGYRTALFGKWHATTNSRPPQRGFDRWLSYDPFTAGYANQYLRSGTVSFSDQGETLEHTGVQARFLTEQAIQFIDEKPAAPQPEGEEAVAAPPQKPFFVSLNFTEPHEPFVGLPERLVSRYRVVAADLIRAGGASDLPDAGSHNRTPVDHVEQLAQYLAAVSLLDEQVGRLLDALQGRDLLDNTIVVYTADHGLMVGQYGLYGKVNATNPANFYEETIRIPLVVSMPPGLSRPAQTRGELVDLIDLHATVLDFASDGEATNAEGPGRSLRPLLAGERNSDWRTLQFAERGNLRMVTDGRWKLVREYQRAIHAEPTDRWYDLAHPFGERHSVDLPPASVRGRLMSELQRFFDQYETEAHSGRRIWDQPPPNARMERDLDAYR